MRAGMGRERIMIIPELDVAGRGPGAITMEDYNFLADGLVERNVISSTSSLVGDGKPLGSGVIKNLCNNFSISARSTSLTVANHQATFEYINKTFIASQGPTLIPTSGRDVLRYVYGSALDLPAAASPYITASHFRGEPFDVDLFRRMFFDLRELNQRYYKIINKRNPYTGNSYGGFHGIGKTSYSSYHEYHGGTSSSYTCNGSGNGTITVPGSVQTTEKITISYTPANHGYSTSTALKCLYTEYNNALYNYDTDYHKEVQTQEYVDYYFLFDADELSIVFAADITMDPTPAGATETEDWLYVFQLEKMTNDKSGYSSKWRLSAPFTTGGALTEAGMKAALTNRGAIFPTVSHGINEVKLEINFDSFQLIAKSRHQNNIDDLNWNWSPPSSST